MIRTFTSKEACDILIAFLKKPYGILDLKEIPGRPSRYQANGIRIGEDAFEDLWAAVRTLKGLETVHVHELDHDGPDHFWLVLLLDLDKEL